MNGWPGNIIVLKDTSSRWWNPIVNSSLKLIMIGRTTDSDDKFRTFYVSAMTVRKKNLMIAAYTSLISMCIINMS